MTDYIRDRNTPTWRLLAGMLALLVATVGAGCLLSPIDVPPPPAPVPDEATHKGLFIITVNDATSSTPETYKLLRDSAYWKTVRDRGNDYRELDIDDPVVKERYTDLVTKAGGPPCVLFWDLKTMKPLPGAKLTDNAGVNKLIKKYTGK